MLLLIFVLSQIQETQEVTVMARPSGAPYVFYKEEPEDEVSILLEDQEDQADQAVEEKIEDAQP